MMKFTLLALLVLFNSSSADGTKRLLLQAAAPAVPAQPAQPAQRAVVTPVQPVQPAPGTPSTGTPGQVTPGQGTPSTGTPGQGTPGQGTPAQVQPAPGQGTPGDVVPKQAPGGVQPTVINPNQLQPGYIAPPPLPGQQNTLPMFAPPLVEQVCGIRYGMPGSCSYRNRFQSCPTTAPANTCGPITLDRMVDNFKLYCDIPYACYGSEFNMNFGGNPMFPMGVRQINQLLFSEPYSGQSATINIRNQQNNGNNIELSNLECNNYMACSGMTLNVWGISVNDVNCDQPENCGGCTINFYTTARVGCQQMIANPLCLIESKPCWGY